MNTYTHRLKEERIFQSMPRKGNCLDNSVIQNFIGLIKQEIYYGVMYYSFNELKLKRHFKISWGWGRAINFCGHEKSSCSFLCMWGGDLNIIKPPCYYLLVWRIKQKWRWPYMAIHDFITLAYWLILQFLNNRSQYVFLDNAKYTK